MRTIPRAVDELDQTLNQQVLSASSEAELNAALKRKLRVKRDLLLWPDRTLHIVASTVLTSLRAGRVE